MENASKQKLHLFASNAQAIKREFKWHSGMTKRLAALLYAQENKNIDCEAIRRSLAMLKQNTGVLSSFRGNMSLCIAALLSLNPPGLFEKTVEAYNALKGVKFWSSDFLVVAAFQIASQAEDISAAANRARDFYDGMKSRNFFATGQDDYIFAAMLAVSDLNVDTGTERIAQIIDRMKGDFWSKNSVQSLAQVLALGKSCDETVSRVLVLRDALRKQRIRLDKTYTLPTLGVLALLPVSVETIVQDISDAEKILRAQKGFGAWSVTKQELLIYAAAVTASEYAESIKSDVVTAAVSTSITNIIIAQQVAMIAAISASTSAAAASSSC